ncbi:LytTR family DNA-binding domain-containing protein [Erythrobacter sp. HA6-11]
MNEPAEAMHEMRGSTVHEARNAWVVARPWLAWPIATALLCLLLSLLGAVNSYQLDLTTRLIFWGSLFAVAVLLAIGIEAVLLRARLSLTPVWRWLAIFSVSLAAAMTPVAYIANSLGGWAPLSMIPIHFANSLIISLAFVGLRIGLGRMLADASAARSATSETNSLMERLPPALQSAKLHAIEADGHYIRVHTDLGSEMVLMRLGDAIAETGGVQGAQVHRSWWVARDAVARDTRKDGKVVLELAGGQEVPVSRTRAKELREADWF